MSSALAFKRHERVRSGHCDPGGIVFFPRYFKRLNALVEDWFTEGLGVDDAQLIGARRSGLPSLRLLADFQRISRIGDVLSQRISIRKLGRSSLTLDVRFDGADGTRVAFEQLLVSTSLDTHWPIPFPDDVRAAGGIQ